MNIEFSDKKRICKTVAEAKEGEAFKYNGEWYITIHFDDSLSEFWSSSIKEYHLENNSYLDYLPVFNINTQTLCFINKTIKNCCWADATFTLSLK